MCLNAKIIEWVTVLSVMFKMIDFVRKQL